MRVVGTEKLSPYGEVTWMDQKDAERLIYVFKVFFEDDDFKPPSAWYCMDSMGNRVYFKARDRKKAIQLLSDFFGGNKYSLISDKKVQIR